MINDLRAHGAQVGFTGGMGNRKGDPGYPAHSKGPTALSTGTPVIVPIWLKAQDLRSHSAVYDSKGLIFVTIHPKGPPGRAEPPGVSPAD